MSYSPTLALELALAPALAVLVACYTNKDLKQVTYLFPNLFVQNQDLVRAVLAIAESRENSLNASFQEIYSNIIH